MNLQPFEVDMSNDPAWPRYPIIRICANKTDVWIQDHNALWSIEDGRLYQVMLPPYMKLVDIDQDIQSSLIKEAAAHEASPIGIFERRMCSQ